MAGAHLTLAVRVAALAGVLGLAACTSSSAAPAPTAPPVTTTPPGPTAGPTTAATVAPATTPVASAPPTGVPATPPATCPVWSEAVVTGRAGAGLDETSGLAAGRRNVGALWAHNDSGDRARVFALDQMGAVAADIEVAGAVAFDWEDMAAAPGPDGTPWLWMADTGDNLTLRPSVTLYGFPEPDLAADPPPMDAEGVQAVTVRYPDGPTDVESLLVDPVTGDAFLVAKAAAADGTVEVYRVPAAQLHDGASVTAEPVARIVGRTDERNGPTAGDVSADGTLVLVSNGREGFLWLRDPSQPLAELFNQQPLAPCRAPIGGGEAVAFEGLHLWSMSEGSGAALRRYDRTG